jgi:general secretion pathway protein A
MYEAYFGLTEKPFTITPDPRYLYLSRRHREALAHLLYGIGEDGGFVLLTGEVGTGKTTVTRALLDQVPEDTDVALILNPRLTGLELVAAICDELQVQHPKDTQSLKVLVDRLNHHLLETHARGRRTVLIIDEAQNLSAETLEQVRLLTNLETTHQKLLRIVLIGQPELNDLLARRELRQLAQRITARYHLGTLSALETVAYVQHRLSVAGVADPLFSEGALVTLHREAGGVPRLINTIADRALLGAYAHDAQRITPRMVRQAAREVTGGRRLRRPLWALGGLAMASMAVAALVWLPSVPPSHAPDEAAGTMTRAAEHAPDERGADQAPTPPIADAARPPAAREPAASEQRPPKPPEPEAPAVAASPDSDEAGSGGQAQEAAPAPPQGPDTDLAGRLAAGTLDGRRETALAGLLALWGVTSSTAPSCEEAGQHGLRCLSGDGNLERLAHLDLPAVLELRDGAGQPHYALLEAMDADEAELVFGDYSERLDRATLESLWPGAFTVLWRPPETVDRTLSRGTAGPAVAWVSDTLDRLAGREPSGGRRYDTELEARIRDFQRSRNLLADGIVGRQTLIHLSSARSDDGRPRLGATAEEDHAPSATAAEPTLAPSPRGS